MKMINGRYKIIELISKNRTYSVYEAIDLKESSQKVNICILNSSLIESNILDFCILKFENLSTNTSRGTIQILDFGIVKDRNDKENKKNYFYVTETTENFKTLVEYVEDISEIDLIKIFAQICNVAYDQSYRYYRILPFQIENIFVSNKVEVKLKDEITNLLECNELGVYKYYSKIEEEMYSNTWENNTSNDYVNSLIYILNTIALINKHSYKDMVNYKKAINQVLYTDSDKYKILFGDKLYGLIEKVYNKYNEDCYKDILQILEDINEAYDTSFSYEENDNLSVLNFNIPLIGRDEEVKLIEKYIDGSYKPNSKNVILLHGEIGIGKTRFLDHLQYLIKNNEKYNSIYFKGKNNRGHRDLIDGIIRKILADGDKNLINKYKKELTTINDNIDDNHIYKVNEGSELDNKSKLILVVKLTSLIEEYYSDKKGIIIIDNIDKYDEYTFSIIKYLINRESIREKITFVLSYRDGDCLNNESFTSFLEQIKDNINQSMHLRPLPEDKCIQMLKCIFNLYDISEEFTNIFYKYSMGNPLFIESAIKDLIKRKKIYPDKKTGRWRRLENPEIYMPTNMEKICKNQLQDIDEQAYEIVYSLAFFDMPISTEILSELLDKNNDVIEKIVEELLINGILYKSISDNGFVYTFYNKFLRSYLYQKVGNDKCKEVHKKIFEILINHYEVDKNSYVEEIIYHLEKLEYKEELLKYYIYNEGKLERLNSNKDAIRCCLKILKTIDSLNNREKYIEEEIETNIKLGKLYNASSDRNKSVDHYKRAKELCLKNNLLCRCVDVLNYIARNYMETGNDVEANKYTIEMKSILDRENYITGKLKYLRITISNAYRKQEFEKAKRLSTYGISLCDENHIDYKIAFSNSYCDALLGENEIDEALEKLKLIVKECEENNYSEALLKLNSSIAVLYCDYIQNGEEALRWLNNLVKLSKMCSNRYFLVNGITNLGFENYILLNYKEAYERFEEAYKMSMQDGLIYDNFYDYIYMGSIMYKTGNYHDAIKFSIVCEAFIKKNPMFGQELVPYRIYQYYICDLLGENEKGLEFLNEVRNVFDETTSVMKYKVELLYCINGLLLQKEGISIQSIIECSKKILYVDLKVSMLCRGIINMMSNDNLSEARELYNYVITFKKQIQKNENKMILDYLGCYLFDNPKVEVLIQDLDNYSDVKNPDILWRIYLQIGEEYYKNNNLANSTIYLSEACDIILELLKQIPKGYKKNYILKNKLMVDAYKILLELKRFYNQGRNRAVDTININVDENIENLFQIIIESDFISDDFVKEIKNQNWSSLKNINTIEELVSSLSDNSRENLKMICKYVTFLSLATRTVILIEQDNSISVFASSDDNYEVPEDMSIINISRSKATEVKMTRKLITDGEGNSTNHDNDSNVKASMCIPITPFTKSTSDESRYDYNHHVLGYIYVESNRKLNNISDDSMEKCIILSRILYMIIDKFNIKYSSTIDKLTGALTRRYLELFIHEQLDRSATLNSEFSTIMIDIDKFKDINDTYGHRMGDVVLQNLCKVIISNIRACDVLGRYGGEEFIVVLPNTNLDETFKIAERIRGKIFESKLMGDKRDVTVSLGVSTYPLHGNAYEELIEKADQALYAAKNSGRNRTKIWNESYGSKVSTTNKLSGIFVGSGNQDYKNVSTVIEFIDMITEESTIEKKIGDTINKIAEITEADICTLFLVRDKEIHKKYSSTIRANENTDVRYNYDRLRSSIETKENICGIDWSAIDECGDNVIPELKSNMIVLLKCKSKVMGAIYLSVDINHKEFTYDELNFVNTLAKVMVPILEF